MRELNSNCYSFLFILNFWNCIKLIKTQGQDMSLNAVFLNHFLLAGIKYLTQCKGEELCFGWWILEHSAASQLTSGQKRLVESPEWRKGTHILMTRKQKENDPGKAIDPLRSGLQGPSSYNQTPPPSSRSVLSHKWLHPSKKIQIGMPEAYGRY